MKLCRSELLLMGGMYQILAFIITLFSSEISFAMNGILYVLFWAAVLALSFSFVSSWGFVYKMNDNFPRLSVDIDLDFTENLSKDEITEIKSKFTKR